MDGLVESQSGAAGSFVATFDGSSVSCRGARRFVVDALGRWGRDDLIDDAVACVAELAANAVLHGRGPFKVAVVPTAGGVRVEVHDSRPTELPVAVPATGAAADLTVESTTGRGLLVVATVASRWGIRAGADTKMVWAEIEPGADAQATAPVVERHESESSPAVAHLLLYSLPVRAAVGSGLQVDELVREVQLGLFDAAVTGAERAAFYGLLDRSAPARLAGRRAALAAAGAGELRFDLDLTVDPAMLDAVAAFGQLLEEFPARHPASAAVADPSVVAFRAWLTGEVQAQLGGNAPSPCPLPDG